jgi:hypothetical protein
LHQLGAEVANAAGARIAILEKWNFVLNESLL